jgi:starch synthase (maltosyl-transferring)
MTKPRLVTVSAEPAAAALAAALKAPRIAIERVSPDVDHGRYPAKATVGQTVAIEADIFMDGHDRIAARVVWLPQAGPARHVPLRPLGNDRWRAEVVPTEPGRQQFTIEAWLDRPATIRHDIEKKAAAGQNVDLEQRELAQALAHPDAQPFLSRSGPHIVDVERERAGFASWYELFPRSQSRDPKIHGTFDDVIARLPAIRAMGFDVLYFPPIHPIGAKNRKGRNNTLRAQPGAPGSPYAIGSAAGGHDAVHPELGGIEAFRRLRAAAEDAGLELALDFAIQFSPDHPWLTQHPGWFSWRPDGTLKFAENPPKKYEDISMCDFYASGKAGADHPGALWLKLRDVILYWVGEGVQTFRVDNPHTKPLPFWEWLIADVRGRHPDVIFLSEAFTRPAMMYRLAKIGFSQSYTYFTWRNTKAELTQYLTELTTQPPRDFYRPHFFVNTPDINPYFLQTSGRPGFVQRAALATTLSGLWGMYSGFELCEGAPLPGKEEYLDSEKYEIKPRNWTAPGNIIGEITRLNHIRRENPALHTHLNVRFYNAFNDQVLYYGKATPDRSNVLLVAVSLDPRNAQETQFEVPLWEFGLPDDGALEVEELMSGARFTWRGKLQHWRFVPQELPFAIWRVTPAGRH